MRKGGKSIPAGLRKTLTRLGEGELRTPFDPPVNGGDPTPIPAGLRETLTRLGGANSERLASRRYGVTEGAREHSRHVPQGKLSGR